MLGIRIKDDKRNDVWFDLSKVCAAHYKPSEIFVNDDQRNEATPAGVEVVTDGGYAFLLKDWTLADWESFVSKTLGQLKLMGRA